MNCRTMLLSILLWSAPPLLPIPPAFLIRDVTGETLWLFDSPFKLVVSVALPSLEVLALVLVTFRRTEVRYGMRDLLYLVSYASFALCCGQIWRWVIKQMEYGL